MEHLWWLLHPLTELINMSWLRVWEARHEQQIWFKQKYTIKKSNQKLNIIVKEKGNIMATHDTKNLSM